MTCSLVSITPVPPAEVTQYIQQALDDMNTNQFYTMELANSSILSRYTYTFSLLVTNWLEMSDEAQVSVTKKETPVPHVEIAGPSLVKIYRNSPLILQGNVTGSVCGDNPSAESFLYRWSVSPQVPLDPTGMYKITHAKLRNQCLFKTISKCVP